MTKTDAITELKQVEEQLKQEDKKQHAEEVKEKAKAADATSTKSAVAEKSKSTPSKDGKATVKPVTTNAAKPADKIEKKEEKKREIVLERLATIPLRIAFAQERADRRPTAARLVREYAARHFKVDSSMVRISNELAALALGNGALRTARSVKARISKDKTGMVLVEMVKK